jgi:uncharacterized DUF497 family protein
MLVLNITRRSRLAVNDNFDWDEGNSNKNWEKHGVSQQECEQSFANQPLYVVDDEKHSGAEPRLIAFGVSDTGRRLFLVFTMRGNRIRVISARPMSRTEREKFDEYVKGYPEL